MRRLLSTTKVHSNARLKHRTLATAKLSAAAACVIYDNRVCADEKLRFCGAIRARKGRREERLIIIIIIFQVTSGSAKPFSPGYARDKFLSRDYV